MTGAAATAINNAGQVAGYELNSNSGIDQAVIWNGTTPTVLGALAGGTGNNVTFGINNNGQEVGLSYLPGGIGMATIWNGTTPTALGTLPGMLNSLALSINNAGVVVGTDTGVGTSGSLGFIWNGTTPISLTTSLELQCCWRWLDNFGSHRNQRRWADCGDWKHLGGWRVCRPANSGPQRNAGQRTCVCRWDCHCECSAWCARE